MSEVELKSRNFDNSSVTVGTVQYFAPLRILPR